MSCPSLDTQPLQCDHCREVIMSNHENLGQMTYESVLCVKCVEKANRIYEMIRRLED